MRVEQEVMQGMTVPFTLDELWEFRKKLNEAFGEDLDTKLKEFSIDFHKNPLIVRKEDRDVACKIFWMLKLIPGDINQN